MRLEAMYQEVILDHYKHPQHSGLREDYDTQVHHTNISCGDDLVLRLKLSADRQTVEDISYEAEGCSISQASVDVLAEEVIGQPVDTALKKLTAFETMITSKGEDEGDPELIGDGVAFAGVAQYPARVKCALLGWEAFKAALSEADSHTSEAENKE